MLSQVLVTLRLAQQDDKGYYSCDSEDLDNGFIRYRECNLADWLGLPWSCGKLEATLTRRAYKTSTSWVSGRRKWGVERRGPGRSKEDRRREQVEREAQGRTVQPVAEERSEHVAGTIGILENAG